MYAGKIVETGTAREVFYEPKHPYTWGLLNSMPDINGTDGSRELAAIPGTPPDLYAPPAGCAFAARCPYAMGACLKAQPEETSLSGTHKASCHLLDPRAPKVPAYETKRHAVEGKQQSLGGM